MHHYGFVRIDIVCPGRREPPSDALVTERGAMEHDTLAVGAKALLSRDGLHSLIAALVTRGYQVLGPTLRDGAIVYDALAGIQDLPAGWTDRQEAGRYQVEKR